MKKIFYLFSIVSMGLLVASCNLNEMPTFNDSDAFAAFSRTSLSVKEDGGVLNVPIHVASLNGTATTVTYELINGSAIQGVDFEDASGSGTISFSAGEREKTIPVKILPHLGVFTGDKSFTIKFKSTGDVKMGLENTCSVTITDIDHPLSALFGTFTATAADYWGDESDFAVTLSKDESDVSKVWISNLDPYFAGYGFVAPDYNFIYGVVNDDMTRITVPRGQAVGYETVVFDAFDDPDPDAAGDNSDILIEIKDGGAKLVVLNAFGTFNPGDGWWSIYYGGLELTK